MYKGQRLKVKCQKSFKDGFTIIELLIVFAIIIIMTAVLLMNQNGNQAQKNVETAARQVAAQLRSLQNEALNGKQAGTVLTPACDFIFTSVANDTKYSVSYNNCSHVLIPGSAQPIPLNSGKGNVSISPATISFSSPRGQVSGSYQLILTSSGKSAYVCVCNSGNIFDTTNSSCSC